VKKISAIFKENSESRIKNSLKDSSSVFIIKCLGLSSPDLTTLRQSLKSVRANLFIVKNTIARRALKDFGLQDSLKFIEGSCGLIFAQGEPVNACKVLYGFSKEHGQLRFEAGFLEKRFLAKNDIEALAKLPPKEVLRAKVVMCLKSPLFGLAGVLKGNLRKLVYCLEQIKLKKTS